MSHCAWCHQPIGARRFAFALYNGAQRIRFHSQKCRDFWRMENENPRKNNADQTEKCDKNRL